jgi:hypothetical protein
VRRFFKRAGKLLLWACGVLLLLAAALCAWFLYAVNSRMDAPIPDTPVTDLLTYRESPAHTPAPRNLHWQVDVTDPDSLKNPGAETRPWTRWWWPGGDVDAAVACEQLRDFSVQGFGGVEIQAFRAGLHVVDDPRAQARINSFDSPGYYATLRSVLDCAQPLRMTVYLNHLSGWPAGGPEVPVDQGLQELRYAQLAIRGGSRVSLPVPVPAAGMNDYFMALAEFFFGSDLKNFLPQNRQLIALVAGKFVGGERAANPFDATDTVALQAGSIVDLTAQVRNGKLEWDAPDGDWLLVAVYILPSGEAPTLIAAARPGFVIDHMNAAALQAHYDYAFGSRTGLQDYYAAPLQGIFNDSLEFMVNRLGAADILEAFRERRGYDLTPHLPAVFADARDNYFIREVGGMRAAPDFSLDDDDQRIAHDYQLTVSDLIIERFVAASEAWASPRGLVSRGQSYGSDFDVIKALGHNAIPETEQLFGGGSELFLKLAGSAGYLYDRPMISAESFVWHNLAYAVEPARLKAAADKLLLNGVNQVIYHGIPYPVRGEVYSSIFGPVGWYPFLGPDNDAAFSGNYGAASAIWQALPGINEYLTRCQNLLRAGRAELDVLVYYPFLGFPLELERSAKAQQEFLFAGTFPDEPPVPQDPALKLPFSNFPDDGGDPRRLWLESIMPVVDALNRQGTTWGWVNDDALTARAASIPAATTVLIANAPWIDAQTSQALVERVARGGKLALYGSLPRQQPGYRDFQSGDRSVQEHIDSLALHHRINAEQLLLQAQSAVRLQRSNAIRRATRRLSDGTGIHFFANQSRLDEQARVLLPSDSLRSAYWFDPRTGDSEAAVFTSDGLLSLTLAALESRFLITPTQAATPLVVHGLKPVTDRAGSTQALTHWTLTTDGLAAQPVELPLPPSVIAQLPQATGALLYSSTVELPAIAGSRYWLAIDRADGTLRVDVNDTQFGALGVPPYRIDITAALRPGQNRLLLTVTPPLRSKLLADFTAEASYAVALAPLRNASVPMGLLGPVSLTKQATSARSDAAIIGSGPPH